jgi:hypothetical protein
MVLNSKLVFFFISICIMDSVKVHCYIAGVWLCSCFCGNKLSRHSSKNSREAKWQGEAPPGRAWLLVTTAERPSRFLPVTRFLSRCAGGTHFGGTSDVGLSRPPVAGLHSTGAVFTDFLSI